RYEVGECVVLLVPLAFIVPAITLLLAATNMRDCINKAAIDKRQAACGEGSRNADAVGAIAIKKAGRGAIKLESFAVDERNRHALTILCLGEDAARHIVGRIVA